MKVDYAELDTHGLITYFKKTILIAIFLLGVIGHIENGAAAASNPVKTEDIPSLIVDASFQVSLPLQNVGLLAKRLPSEEGNGSLQGAQEDQAEVEQPHVGLYYSCRALAYGFALVALVCGSLYQASRIVVGGRKAAGYLLAVFGIGIWIIGMLELGRV
jgi:hypothetical protein